MPDRYKYLGKLLVLSTLLHGFFFVSIIFLYQINHPSRFSIVINQRMNDAKIVFVPTIKTVPGGLASLAQTQIKQQPKKIVQVAPIKKVGKKAPEKKPIAKKIEPPKPKPQPSKTAVVKKESKPQLKKVEQKPQQKPKPKAPEQKIEPQLTEKVAHDASQDIIYLGREDKALLAIHNQVQSEIEKTWHPPVGLSKDLVCSIKVKVDKKGSILGLALEESSKVISYDIAARTALDMMSFPKSLWGKEVVITFKQ